MVVKMSETIHNLKPGDMVYALPILSRPRGQIGVNEFRVTRATEHRVTGISTPRSAQPGPVKYTFYACKFGTEWFLTPEAALIQVISLLQKEIDANQKRIDQAEAYLAIVRLEKEETATP
jgi:hypothetical protein